MGEKGDEEKEVPKEDLDDVDLESFGEKKKKKKKKPALNMKDLEEALPDDKAEDNDDVDLESFGTKKKKKKRGKIDDVDYENKENEGENETTAWANQVRDYTYDELLQRV